MFGCVPTRKRFCNYQHNPAAGSSVVKASERKVAGSYEYLMLVILFLVEILEFIVRHLVIHLCCLESRLLKYFKFILAAVHEHHFFSLVLIDQV